jgi:DNA mismatch repair protein MutS
LTQLADELPELANVHLDAVEHEEAIRFMHAVQEGAANKSYGLQVAQLAGVPRSVIQQAKRKLAELEDLPTSNIQPQARQEQQLNLLNSVDDLRLSLKQINPDNLTPKQALEYLYQLKTLAAED